jgi:uncharacterized membrane protein
MHLVPQSWSHVHILIGVFPTVGLMFVLGFYVAGIATNNDFLRRTCLIMFAGLGLLGLPIYASAVGSAADLAGNARYARAMIDSHSLWGMAVLALLAATGIAAAVEWWRSRQENRPSGDPFRLILGLAVVTLLVSGVASQIGFQVNHNELKLSVTIPELSTSQVWSNVHIMLNHIPTAGFVFALAFFVVALAANNDGMKRGSLVAFAICSVAGVPTFVAGTAAMWAVTQPTIPDISKAVINSHRDMALLTLVGLAFTGTVAWVELWRSRATGRLCQASLNAVLVSAIVTLAIMSETGHRGGLINHPEIRTAMDVLPTDPEAGISQQLEAIMKEFVWFVPWQLVHFFGYCFIFGAIAAVMLRVLGFWKSVSFAAMHRVLVVGLIGVLMNVLSGMLMMFSDSYRYVVSYTPFAPKIVLLTIGSIAVLYFSVSDRVWNVQAGQDASLSAKWVAVAVLIAWAGVIACGRLLAFI